MIFLNLQNDWGKALGKVYARYWRIEQNEKSYPQHGNGGDDAREGIAVCPLRGERQFPSR